MPDPYDIVDVESDWVVGHEEMGSKKKFWYRDGDDLWLFKVPQENTGEHWAEKIAEQAASGLGIVHAEVELARHQKKRGTATRSFARGGGILYHGNQILEKIFQDYDPDKKFRQTNHTIDNILKAIETIFVTSEGAKLAKTRIADYVVLDALIGNTDRHHENWGILGRRVANLWKGFVAPRSIMPPRWGGSCRMNAGTGTWQESRSDGIRKGRMARSTGPETRGVLRVRWNLHGRCIDAILT